MASEKELISISAFTESRLMKVVSLLVAVSFLWATTDFPAWGASKEIRKMRVLSDPEMKAIKGGNANNDAIIGLSLPRDIELPKLLGTEEGKDSFDPVKGSFFTEDLDFAIQGRGLDIEFKRHYSTDDSSLAYSGPLGPGWTHSYNIYLTLDETENEITLHEGDGSTVKFFRNSGYDTCKTQMGKHCFLILEQNNWHIRYPSLVKYYFNADEQISRIEDKCGNQIQFTYTGGKLTKIKDTVGREIGLSYDGSLLQQVTLPSGDYFRYHYESGRLSAIVKHSPGQNPSFVYLQRYYYDVVSENRMKVKVLPSGLYEENNAPSWNKNCGDRIVNWYDGDDRLVYQEAVNYDGDGYLSNDIVANKVLVKYLSNSTEIYYCEDNDDITNGARDPDVPPPALPTDEMTDYYIRTVDYDDDNQIVEERLRLDPSSQDVIVYKYAYDAEGNRTTVTRDRRYSDICYRYQYVPYKEPVSREDRYLDRVYRSYYATNTNTIFQQCDYHSISLTQPCYLVERYAEEGTFPLKNECYYVFPPRSSNRFV